MSEDKPAVWEESLMRDKTDYLSSAKMEALTGARDWKAFEEEDEYDKWEHGVSDLVDEDWTPRWELHQSGSEKKSGVKRKADKAPADPSRSYSRDERETKAMARNEERIQMANREDENRLGKHLPSDPSAIFPGPWEGPDDFSAPSREWEEEVARVCQEEVDVPRKSRIAFGLSEEDLSSNEGLLEEFGFDLTKLLEAERGSTVDPGSEFRPSEKVRRLVGGHPNFKFLSDVLEKGMDYHFTSELSEEDQRRELELQLDRGNHPSAMVDVPRLKELLEKDVKHGFCMPVRSELVRRLKGAMVQPCGMVEQYSLQADGSRVLKRRLTHDLSFGITKENASVNSRIDMTKYPDMVYGWCLTRVIHFAVCLRAEFPGRKIWAQKFDYADAYRRMAHSGKAAAQTIIVLEGVAYIMLRLAFGGSPNPASFCGFSELLTDLSNELACTRLKFDQIHLPTVKEEHLVPIPYANEDEPIGEGIVPAFKVSTSLKSRHDCFIDDIINVFLGEEGEWRKECSVVPAAIQILSRPHAGADKEPIRRRPLLGPDKLEAEGRPAEVQVILGWELDFRRLSVALPQDKFIAWDGDLVEIIEQEKTTFGQLDSVVGRLNHAAYVIPLTRHFLGPMRSRLKNRRFKRQVLRMSQAEVELFRTWRSFLRIARDGISMNLLTIREPTRVGWSDSCPYGLGGFLQSGRAWRIRVPSCAAFLGDDTANNVLEFLALAINAMLMLEEAAEGGERFPCIMPVGDNTSGIGWVFRSGKVDRKSKYFEPVQEIARKLAMATLEGEAQLCPQHLPGEHNEVADLLSFSGTVRGKTNPLTEDEPDDELLTARSSGTFRNIPTERKDGLLRLCRYANSRIFLAAKQEASFENVDRTWRRWSRFTEDFGLDDAFLDGIPQEDKEVVLRGFFAALRFARFDVSGNIVGHREEPVVASTLRDAASFLGQAFRRNNRPSPVHLPVATVGRSALIESVRQLLNAFEKEDPPPKRQAALTPELLRTMDQATQAMREQDKHVSDLIIGAFFFAMRACEFCETPARGRTKLLTLRNVVFRTEKKVVIQHDDPDLETKAAFVTICFVDQKNGMKMDKRSQGRSKKERVCPVRAWARVVKRTRATVKDANEETPVCSVRGKGDRNPQKVSSRQVADLLQSTCRIYGGKQRFGYEPDDLGTRSIRSGAAMALFMMNESVERIKILGRWSSDAFLVYIRPQVLEWTNIMAEEMADTKDFLDLRFGSDSKPDCATKRWKNDKVMSFLPRWWRKNG